MYRYNATPTTKTNSNGFNLHSWEIGIVHSCEPNDQSNSLVTSWNSWPMPWFDPAPISICFILFYYIINRPFMSWLLRFMFIIYIYISNYIINSPWKNHKKQSPLYVHVPLNLFFGLVIITSSPASNRPPLSLRHCASNASVDACAAAQVPSGSPGLHGVPMTKQCMMSG